MLAAAAVMYAVAHHELRSVARGGSVGGSADMLMMTIFAIMVAFSALCAVGFYRFIFRPLSELNHVISRRAEGDRRACLNWRRTDEIGRIGGNFDAMVDAINVGEERLREFAANTVRALALAVDAKDPYTRHHSERVARYTVAIAETLKLSAGRVEQLRTAGVLHDVGKIAVPDAILLSPSALSEEEFEVMKGHSVAGERLVAGAGMTEIARWVRHHHERFDGRGYPDGLAAAEIAPEARILAVADSFEAMTSDRYYRAALSIDQAVAELHRNAGSQFDPELVEAMAALVSDGIADGADRPAGEARHMPAGAVLVGV
jgi:HD-GYP domain-containing protein (c-di-GMP phosphodiesterase class II)